MLGLGDKGGKLYFLLVFTAVALMAMMFLVMFTLHAPAVYAVNDPAEIPGVADGECLSVSQDRTNVPQIDRVPCQTAASVYRVIDRVGDPGKCVSDSDAQYKLRETFLCLDYDWDRTNCIAIYAERPFKEQCGRSLQSLRPEMIVVGGRDVSYCKNTGISHPVRKYTVCLTDN